MTYSDKQFDPALTRSQVDDIKQLLEAGAVSKSNKDFLKSLCDAHDKYNGLTVKQAYWMDKLFNEMMRPPVEPKDDPVISGADDEGVLRLKQIIQNSHLYFTVADTPVKLYWNKTYESMSICHRTIYPSHYGMFSFKHHTLKLNEGGVSTDLSVELTSLVRALVNKPDETIAKYGIASGMCGMCGKELTDPKSIEVGIGPVCQKKMGYKAT